MKSASTIYLKNTYGCPAYYGSNRLPNLFNYLRQLAEKIWASEFYEPALMAIATAFLILPKPQYGCLAVAALGSFMLIFCWDIMAAFMPTLLFCLLTTDYFEDYGQLLRQWPMFIVVAAARVLHFPLYRAPLKRGKMTHPLLAVSAATVLGGLGEILPEEYFSSMSVYYVVGLGPAMLCLYTLLCSQLQKKRSYDILGKMLDTIYYSGIFAGIVILNTYIARIDEFIGAGTSIFISYRNYCATVMLTALPCACVRSKNGKYKFGGMWFDYFCLLFSGSRSGLVFGTILLMGCLAYMYLRSENKKQLRIRRILPVAVPTACAVIAYVAVKFFTGRLIDGNLFYADDCRYLFLERGLQDFISSPIFGIGLGNSANSDIYVGVSGSMVWYHNAIAQIFGSMGIVGAAAYGWMYASRVKLLRARSNAKTPIVAMSALGMLLVSMTNPGEFCPMPNAFIMVALFAVLEMTPERTHKSKKRIAASK